MQCASLSVNWHLHHTGRFSDEWWVPKIPLKVTLFLPEMSSLTWVNVTLEVDELRMNEIGYGWVEVEK